MGKTREPQLFIAQFFTRVFFCDGIKKDSMVCPCPMVLGGSCIGSMHVRFKINYRVMWAHAIKSNVSI